MSNPFNDVPYDVLQYHLAKYLDLDSTVNFNRVVEQRDRVSRRIPKNKRIEHHFNVAVTRAASVVGRVEMLPFGQRRTLEFYRVLKMNQDPMIIAPLIQYSITYRSMIYRKFKEHEDPNSVKYQIQLSPSWKASFIKLAKKGLLFLEKYPYQCEIRSLKN